MLTTLSSPRKNNIIKNIMAQNCGSGSIPIASGYVINAKAGPPVATEEKIGDTINIMKSYLLLLNYLPVLTGRPVTSKNFIRKIKE